MKQIPIGVSARHIHLTEEHIGLLFGNDYVLHVFKELSQPGQYAAIEVVKVQGPRGCFEKVRILGPARKSTQLEISRTDSYALGLTPPVRLSGNIANTPGILIIGPAGQVEISQGVIVAARHIHVHPLEAQAYGLLDKQMIQVRLNGDRPLILENVAVRISEQFALDLHIDTDEANAAGVSTGEFAEIVEG